MNAKDKLLRLVSKNNREKYEYLSEIFKDLPDIMEKEFHYIEVKKNEKIILGGERAEYVYIILDGEIKGVDYHHTGSVYSFLDLSKTYIFGDFELFSNLPEYMISIYANQDCKLLRVSADRYMKWIRHDENALYMRLTNVLKILTTERMMDRKYLRMGCKERIISYFVIYYEKNKKPSSQNVTVFLTQAELSEKVAFNIRSVQRAIASLEMKKLITIENRKIMISQKQYLALIDEMNK